jgi:hypothetical protein
VRVLRSDAARDGFVTDDGWEVRFDRFVTALGDISLHLDGCVDYSRSQYNRLYDFTVSDDAEVGQIYGLGRCNVHFRMRAPSSDALLTEGITEADREAMRLEASDAYTTDRRVALLVRGRAERDGVTKEMFWLFRRSLTYKRCFAPGSEDPVSTLALDSGEVVQLELSIRPEELFRELPTADAPITFDRFADADADADGMVSLEELAEVEVPLEEILEVAQEGLPEEITSVAGDQIPIDATLATLVYEILVPRVAAIAGTTDCQFEARWRWWFR